MYGSFPARNGSKSLQFFRGFAPSIPSPTVQQDEKVAERRKKDWHKPKERQMDPPIQGRSWVFLLGSSWKAVARKHPTVVRLSSEEKVTSYFHVFHGTLGHCLSTSFCIPDSNHGAGIFTYMADLQGIFYMVYSW